jgi:ferrous iron transport protein A
VSEISTILRARTVRPLADRSSTRVALSTLKPGARGVIVALDHDGDVQSQALSRRLVDLGFAPGTDIEVVRKAPAGDPFVYRVRGYEICLRSRQASTILVEVAG